ncbi:MAG TPA: cytochrome b [Stellaceae bacterium]|nr:cytochrome b [Stellaceae bacterium]
MKARNCRPHSYDPVMRAVHWITLGLITAVFMSAWAAHSGFAGESFRQVMQVHRSLGLTVLGLTVFRLLWRRQARIPALPPELPVAQKLAARATEAVLYGLLIGQPLLGLLQTNARGQRVDFFLLGQLPAIVGVDKPLARQLHDMHELVATLLLALIGLHAAAALFHHFIRRDDVLNAMLPERWRRVRAGTAQGAAWSGDR